VGYGWRYKPTVQVFDKGMIYVIMEDIYAERFENLGDE
jgi:hypothetical protein